MTETREGTDVVERAAMAHCAMAVDLGLSVTPWDGLRQGDRVVARMCMEAATADMRAKLTRLRSENEALKEALRPFFDGFSYDPGHSDLDNEQPISVRVQLGDWRRARRVLAALSKALGEGQEDNG